MIKSITLALLAIPLLSSAQSLPNPFFAMDTATKTQYPKEIPPVAAQLDLVKELGYAGICWTIEEPEKVKNACVEAEKRGLKVFSVYVGATLTKDKLDIDPRLPGMMTALKGHDCILWLHITSKDFKSSSPDGDAIAIPALRKLAGDAASNNLRVALYPHTWDWTERVQDCVRVAKKVDRKNFGVTFNLCHCLKVGDEKNIPIILDEAFPHLFVVTINGADSSVPNANWSQLIRPLGQGTFDVSTVLKKLKSLNYTGPIGFQGYGIKGDRRELLTKTITAWRSLSN